MARYNYSPKVDYTNETGLQGKDITNLANSLKELRKLFELYTARIPPDLFSNSADTSYISNIHILKNGNIGIQHGNGISYDLVLFPYKRVIDIGGSANRIYFISNDGKRVDLSQEG